MGRGEKKFFQTFCVVILLHHQHHHHLLVVVVLLPQRQRVFSKPAISWYATEGIMATVEVQYASTALDHDGVDLGVVIGSTKDPQLETAQEYPSPDHVTNGTYSRASGPALTG